MQRFRNAKVYLGLVAGLLVAEALMPSNDRGQFALIAALVLAVAFTPTALRRWPGADEFVSRRAPQVVLGGLSFAIVGSISIFTLSASLKGLSPAASEALTWATVACLLIGFCIAALPSFIRNSRQSEAELNTLVAASSVKPSFNFIDETTAALRSLVVDAPMFIRIAGPWLVVVAVVTFTLILAANSLGHDRIKALAVLLGILVVIIASLYVAPATVAVAWFRWRVEGRRPARWIVMPDRPAMALAWRLWLFLSILGAGGTRLDSWLRSMADARMTNAISGNISLALLLIAIGLASSFAIRFPALAIGDKRFTRSAALIYGRRLWPSFPMALICSVAPFVIAGWAVDWVWEHVVKPAAHVGPVANVQPSIVLLITLELLVFFAAIASGATLLVSAYGVAKDQLAGTAPPA